MMKILIAALVLNIGFVVVNNANACNGINDGKAEKDMGIQASDDTEGKASAATAKDTSSIPRKK